MKLLKSIIAWLQSLELAITNYLHKIETKKNQKKMETTVTTDLSGLEKFATFKDLQIDGDGNFSLIVSLSYKDAKGRILVYEDNAEALDTISGKLPVDPANPTPAEVISQGNYAGLIAALTPAMTAVVQALV